MDATNQQLGKQSLQSAKRSLQKERSLKSLNVSQLFQFSHSPRPCWWQCPLKASSASPILEGHEYFEPRDSRRPGARNDQGNPAPNSDLFVLKLGARGECGRAKFWEQIWGGGGWRPSLLGWRPVGGHRRQNEQMVNPTPQAKVDGWIWSGVEWLEMNPTPRSSCFGGVKNPLFEVETSRLPSGHAIHFLAMWVEVSFI